ncbi:membrane peptidoglycan carboxypeptidase [Bradyrhizobium sp. USDA 4474]
MVQNTPSNWKTRIRNFFLDLDARIDSSLFSSAKGIRELYERYSTFMDRFYVGRWKRWVFIEPLSEAATIGLGGMVLMLILAIPAFRETADEDWLKKSDLAVTFLDRYGNPIGSRGIKHNDSIPLEDFPDVLIKATLATEDRRFYEHFGIDIAGTARALVTNAQAGGVRQGGSSITQQLAKNLFLSNERTIERKINEAFLAVWLEWRLTKNEILKLYLDRAYMGGGTFGVDGAAHFYFNKSARDVTLAEAAMLAGLFKAPTKYAPHINLPAARARANVVLDNLVDAGFMTEGQVFGARRNPAFAVDRRDEASPNYYLDYAFDEMRKLVDTFPKSYTERVFVVRLAIDTNVQKAAEDAIENQLRQFGRDYHATQAATVVSDLDGGIRAMVGGRDYGASQFNRAVDAYRQPGSSFKPYVYTTALLNGFTPNSVVVDGPVCIGNWCPQNVWPFLFRCGDADAGDHALDQRRAGEAVDRDRPEGTTQGAEPGQDRPGQDRRGRAPFRPQGAAARYAVAADRFGRGHRARACGGLCDLPEPRQGGDATFDPRSTDRRRRSGLALGPRRPKAEAGDSA